MAKILLVDDDPQILYLTQKVLMADKHHVITASNGQEALEIIKTHTPHLVITDICMPIIDGAELIRTLRKTLPILPIIATSAGQRVISSEFALESADMAGATLLLQKPLVPEELREAITTLLS